MSSGVIMLFENAGHAADPQTSVPDHSGIAKVVDFGGYPTTVRQFLEKQSANTTK